MKKLILGIAVCCGISVVNGMSQGHILYQSVYLRGKTSDGVDKIIMRNGRSNIDFCSGYDFRKPFGYIAQYRSELYRDMIKTVNSFAVPVSDDQVSAKAPVYEVSRSAIFDVVAYALEAIGINVFSYISEYTPFSNILKLNPSCNVDVIKELLSEQIKMVTMPEGSVCLDDSGRIYINHEQKLWAEGLINSIKAQ